MSGERVAVVCFDNPFLRPLEGGKRSMASRIRALELLDIRLDIFALNKRSEGMVDVSTLALGPRTSFHQYRMRRSNPLMVLSRYPLSASKRSVKRLANDLNRYAYDAVIFEGEHVVPYRLRKMVSGKRNILYYHDIESRYRAELAQSIERHPQRLLQSLEARKFAALEDTLGRLFDVHVFISSSELVEMRDRLELGDSARYAPYALEGYATQPAAPAESSTLLYVGDLTVDNNYRSVEWFAREVMPHLSDANPRVQLRVVGRIDPARRETLQKLDSRVLVLGYVESLDSEYQEAACVIAPVLYGAGVKVKLLDAMAQGQIVIASSKACEGTGVEAGRHLLVADDAREMAALCQSVLDRRESHINLAQEALDYIKQWHSIEAHAEILKSAIEGAS